MSEHELDAALRREPHNPYAPPGALPATRTKVFPSPLLCAFVGTQIIVLGGLVAIFFGAAKIVLAPVEVAAVLAGVLGLFWLRNQWKRLPARLQMVKNQGVTPGQAAIRNIIPFYNLYWMFVVNAALCDGINSLLAKKDRPRAAPIWLATFAPLTTIALQVLGRVGQALPVSLIALVLYAVTWSTYTIRVELAFDEAKRKRAA